MWKDVKESGWSADHIARHGVTLQEVREAILYRPYWTTSGKNDSTLIYGRTRTGRYLFVVAVDDGGEAFIVTARDMTNRGYTWSSGPSAKKLPVAQHARTVGPSGEPTAATALRTAPSVGWRMAQPREEDLQQEGEVRTMSNGTEKLPRPASELEALATYYDEHDTADEMEDGRWVEPMVTTSLRLPREMFELLKENARQEGKRHTAYIREILERDLRTHQDSADAGELKKINRKLDTLLKTVQSSAESPTRRNPKKAVASGAKTSKAKPPRKGAGTPAGQPAKRMA